VSPLIASNIQLVPSVLAGFHPTVPSSSKVATPNPTTITKIISLTAPFLIDFVKIGHRRINPPINSPPRAKKCLPAVPPSTTPEAN